MDVFEHLEIETIGSCNRTCGTCLRQTYVKKDDSVHRGRFPVTSEVGVGTKMPISTFKGIIDQAVDMGFKGSVCLQHYNEPLLDDRLPELGEYVKSKPQIAGAYACSNMDLITEEMAAKLDGVFVRFDVALYMSEERQIEREKYLLGLFKKTALFFTKGVHTVTHYNPHVGTVAYIKAVQSTPCTAYNGQLIIAYDGTILHCCEDYAGNFGLGNANTMSLKEIWESNVHRELVDTLSKPGGRLKYSYCSVCPRG